MLTDSLIHCIVVVELDEGEAATLASGFVSKQFNGDYIPELEEVFTKAFLIVVILKTAYEQLLHGYISLARFAFGTGQSTLGFHSSGSERPHGIDLFLVRYDPPPSLYSLAVDDVRTVLLGPVDHERLCVGDEAEAARSLGGSIAHHHNIDHLAPLAVEQLQVLLGGVRGQPADEELTQVLQLAYVLPVQRW